MRLATLIDGTPDGRLVVVSPDGESCATTPVRTMQEALDNWAEVAPQLQAITEYPDPLDLEQIAAPLPRAWQWLDGSVFACHGELMDKALGIEAVKPDFPQMYQGASDTFYGPTEDVPMISEDLGIDFEGEFGIITNGVPMGTSAKDAAKHIVLLVQINDWSLRKLAGPEMKTGFGWINAKPQCGMAPFAITPDELGDKWANSRICLDLKVSWNGKQFGNANGEPMAYGFDELVAHAAMTRNLVPGTVIGSGTVSNTTYREVGSSCIAERRGIEMVDYGEPRTPFMKYGDTVTMEAHLPDGSAPFGTLHQTVVEP